MVPQAREAPTLHVASLPLTSAPSSEERMTDQAPLPPRSTNRKAAGSDDSLLPRSGGRYSEASLGSSVNFLCSGVFGEQWLLLKAGLPPFIKGTN